MNNLPLISVCIPTYNREKILSHTLESVLNQTYKNIEIIISDNCSNDKTWKIIKDYAHKDERIKIFQMKRNVGPVKNWQNCFNHSRGEYIKFLWSDDYLDLDYLEKSIKVFGEDIGFIYSPVKWYNISNMKINHNIIGYKPISNLDISFFIQKLIMGGDVPVSGSCALFRRKIISKVFTKDMTTSIGLDCTQNGAGIDALMFLCTGNEYEKFSYLQDTFTYFGVDSDSLTIKYGEKLIPYYFSTFYDFICKYDYNSLIPKFKSRVVFYKTFYIHDIKSKELLDILLSKMVVDMDIKLLIKIILSELLMKKIIFFIKKIYVRFLK